MAKTPIAITITLAWVMLAISVTIAADGERVVSKEFCTEHAANAAMCRSLGNALRGAYRVDATDEYLHRTARYIVADAFGGGFGMVFFQRDGTRRGALWCDENDTDVWVVDHIPVWLQCTKQDDYWIESLTVAPRDTSKCADREFPVSCHEDGARCSCYDLVVEPRVGVSGQGVEAAETERVPPDQGSGTGGSRN